MIGFAADILAERQREPRVGLLEVGRFEQLAQHHDLAALVGQLDADDVAAGHHRDAGGDRAHRAGDVVGKPDDARGFGAGRRLELIQRDHGARAHIGDLALDAEILASTPSSSRAFSCSTSSLMPRPALARGCCCNSLSWRRLVRRIMARWRRRPVCSLLLRLRPGDAVAGAVTSSSSSASSSSSSSSTSSRPIGARMSKEGSMRPSASGSAASRFAGLVARLLVELPDSSRSCVADQPKPRLSLAWYAWRDAWRRRARHSPTRSGSPLRGAHSAMSADALVPQANSSSEVPAIRKTRPAMKEAAAAGSTPMTWAPAMKKSPKMPPSPLGSGQLSAGAGPTGGREQEHGDAAR